jgi:hypothetical protein
MAEQAGESHYGAEVRKSAEEKAERIVAGELKKLKWTEAELEGNRKGDVQKVRIARRLRKETTVTLKWIAHRLRIGHMDPCVEPALPCRKMNLCQNLGPTPLRGWPAALKSATARLATS